MKNLLKTGILSLLCIMGLSVQAQIPCGDPTGGTCTNPFDDYTHVLWQNPSDLFDTPANPVPLSEVNQNVFYFTDDIPPVPVLNCPDGVPQTIISNLGNTTFDVGDELGMFFERNDTLVCVGYSVYQEDPSDTESIVVYGDDIGTPIQESYASGEPFEIMLIRKVSTGKSYYIDFEIDGVNSYPCGNVIADPNGDFTDRIDSRLESMTVLDCAGIEGGPNTLDACDVCDDDPTNDNTTCAVCSDPDACNFDPTPDVIVDDNTCEFAIAGTIATTDELTVCAGDGAADVVSVTVSGNNSAEYVYVITDGTGTTILGSNDTGTFDVEGAGGGNCLIWGVAHDGSLGIPDDQVANLTGCFELSNSIAVVRETYGCMDAAGCNFNPDATCGDQTIACGCEPGCTDANACNFNPDAETDDGTCVDAGMISTTDETTICSLDGSADVITVTATGNSGTNYFYVITDATGTQILGSNDTGVFDLEGTPVGNCLIWGVSHDGSIDVPTDQVADITGCFALSNAIEVVRQDVGCTDAMACNFDAAALCDDGSCEFPNGCTDTAACNFDPAATCDDGSCQLPDGCTDDKACNFDPAATCDDGSCIARTTYFEDVDGDGIGDSGSTIEACAPPTNSPYVTTGGDVCPTLDNALFGQPCDDGNPATVLSEWSSLTCECEPISTCTDLDLPNNGIERDGALYGITDFPISGNEVYTWYNDQNEQVAQFTNNPYFAPQSIGTYYLIVTDPDFPECFQYLGPVTIDETNGCCELESDNYEGGN